MNFYYKFIIAMKNVSNPQKSAGEVGGYGRKGGASYAAKALSMDFTYSHFQRSAFRRFFCNRD